MFLQFQRITAMYNKTIDDILEENKALRLEVLESKLNMCGFQHK